MIFLVDSILFASGYISLLFVYVALRLWDQYAGKPLSVETKEIIYGIAFLQITFSSWRRHRQRAKDEKAEAALEAAQQKASAPRTFAENSSALLDRFGQGGILADKLLIPYLDKWISVSGTLEGVAESLLHDAMHLTLTLENGRRIYLRFGLHAREKLESLKGGQQLAALAQIKPGSGLGVYSLDNAELVRVQPLRSRVTATMARSA